MYFGCKESSGPRQCFVFVSILRFIAIIFVGILIILDNLHTRIFLAIVISMHGTFGALFFVHPVKYRTGVAIYHLKNFENS